MRRTMTLKEKIGTLLESCSLLSSAKNATPSSPASLEAAEGTLAAG